MMKDKTTNWDEIGYLIGTMQRVTFTYVKILQQDTYV